MRRLSILALAAVAVSCSWFQASGSVDETPITTDLRVVFLSVPPDPNPVGPFEMGAELRVERSGMTVRFLPYKGKFDTRLVHLKCVVDDREIDLDLTQYVSTRIEEFDLGMPVVPYVHCRGVDGSTDTDVSFAIGFPDATVDTFVGIADGALAGETIYGETSVLEVDGFNLWGVILIDMISGCKSSDCDWEPSS